VSIGALFSSIPMASGLQCRAYASNAQLKANCCMLGSIHYQLNIFLLQPEISSIHAQLISKQIVFRIGKLA
jgi:shikimate kinase